jgi:hypothetical protein
MSITKSIQWLHANYPNLQKNYSSMKYLSSTIERDGKQMSEDCFFWKKKISTSTRGFPFPDGPKAISLSVRVPQFEE